MEQVCDRDSGCECIWSVRLEYGPGLGDVCVSVGGRKRPLAGKKTKAHV